MRLGCILTECWCPLLVIGVRVALQSPTTASNTAAIAPEQVGTQQTPFEQQGSLDLLSTTTVCVALRHEIATLRATSAAQLTEAKKQMAKEFQEKMAKELEAFKALITRTVAAQLQARNKSQSPNQPRDNRVLREGDSITAADVNLASGVPSEDLEDLGLQGFVDTDGISIVMPSAFPAVSENASATLPGRPRPPPVGIQVALLTDTHRAVGGPVVTDFAARIARAHAHNQLERTPKK